MAKFEDVTGNKFGRLTVIYGLKKDDSDERWLRQCQCDCGNIVWKTLKWLKKPYFRFCGPNCKFKICSRCKIDKPISQYHQCKSNKNGVSSKCKICVSLYYTDNVELLKDKYKENRKNPNKVSAMRKSGKASRDRYKDREKAYKKIYHKKENVIERSKRIHRERKETDIIYNIKRRLRGRLRDTLKSMSKNSFKHKSSLLILGCDMIFFKEFIENQFQEGMSWSNMNMWHLDHIRPCNSFSLDKIEDQLICFNYKNIQPLWQDQNLKKGHKWDNTNSSSS